MTHTTKPWHCNEDDADGCIVTAGNTHLTRPIKKADALLIAAAPDLLEALRLMLIATMPDEDGYSPPTKSVFEHAHAAFNKATGQQ
jgi:hypothetical protein